MSDSLRPLDCRPPGSSVRGICQARTLEGAAVFSSRDLPGLGIEPTSLESPVLAGGFFTISGIWEARTQVKTKNNLRGSPAKPHHPTAQHSQVPLVYLPRDTETMDKQIISFSRKGTKNDAVSVNNSSWKHRVLLHSIGNYIRQPVTNPNGKEYEKKESLFGGVKSWFQVWQFRKNGPSGWCRAQERKIPAHG